MKQPIFAILFAVLVGAAAAFFRPAKPYQVPSDTNPAIFAVPRGGSSVVMDAGLDNEDIEVDTNITPSRKCGFCMGKEGRSLDDP
jgi:hypothetical protein